MKYYNNILKYIFPVWILIGNSFCGDLNIDLTLLNTSQFNLNNWGTLEELWYVNVQNTSSQRIDYYLEYTLNKGSDEVMIGRTKPLYIEAADNKTYKNLDDELNTDALVFYWEDPSFISGIETQSGYLPPGFYTLVIIAKNLQDDPLSSDQEELEIPLGDQFYLEFPDDYYNIGGVGELAFQWSTPGFRDGIQIEFRLIIAAIVPGETDTPEDAIEMGSSSVFYFDSKWEPFPLSGGNYPWPYVEHGTSQSLWSSYSSLISETFEEPLICGYDYAWRMEAREIIDACGQVSGCESFKLVVVGKVDEEVFENEFLESIRSSPIKYQGWVPLAQAYELIAQSRGGLALYYPEPNHFNSEPTKLYEYMAAGVPVITSNFKKYRELVETLKCGIVVDPTDAGEIAKAIMWILNNSEEAQAMGCRGRKAVEERFHWGLEERKLVNLYDGLASGPI